MIRICGQIYNHLPARGAASIPGKRVGQALPLRGFKERFANPYEQAFALKLLRLRADDSEHERE